MLSEEEIRRGLDAVAASPRDRGTLDMIVVRPAQGERRLTDSATLSLEEGLPGDRWLTTCWLKLPEGGPDPRVQLSLMNTRILRLIAGTPDRMPLAGDNLIVDFDFSRHNVSPGLQLDIGEARIAITEIAHNGCPKMVERYGRAAVRLMNSAEGKQMGLRGVYAQIIRPGLIRRGDMVTKVMP